MEVGVGVTGSPGHAAAPQGGSDPEPATVPPGGVVRIFRPTDTQSLGKESAKGAILYQPGWAARRRFRMRGAFILAGTTYFLMPFMFVGVFAWATRPGTAFSDPPALCLLLAFALPLRPAAWYTISLEVRIMPFRIYENGFTLTRVSFLDGLLSQEAFVPWDRLESVRIQPRRVGVLATRELVFVHSGGQSLGLGFAEPHLGAWALSLNADLIDPRQ